MGQPFTANWRIHLPYLVDSIDHKLFVFCKIQYDGSDAKLSDRTTGDKAYLWSLGAQRLGAAISTMLPAGSSYGTILLEQLVGKSWIAQEAYTYSGSPGASTVYKCTQFTLTLRDDDYNKVKVVVLDTAHPAPQKYNVKSGGGSNMVATVAAFIEDAANVNDPYHWMVSRSNNFLHPVPFVGSKMTLNSQLEGRRNL